jgi:hypothetical protein
MKLHEEFKLFETLWDDLVSAYPELEDEAPDSSTAVSPNSFQGKEKGEEILDKNNEKVFREPEGMAKSNTNLAKAKEIRAEIARLRQELSSLDLEDIETSSVWAKIPGTSKKIEKKGVSNQEALESLINFINGLSSEEKLAIDFYWGNDSLIPGDCEGDPILNKDSGDDTIYDNTWTARGPIPADAYDDVEAALGF